MRHLRLSILSVLSAALLSGPTVPLRVPSPRQDMIVKHKWDVIPDDWICQGLPPDDTTIDLYIALQPEHKNALTDVVHEVSQPGHPKYGAHLSKEQVAELVAPHPDTLELVTSWLEHNGLGVPPSSISTTHGGDWLTVTDVPVSQANELLGASYQLYYHYDWNDTILRTAGYALPAALHEHVKTIIPTTAFTPTRLRRQTPRRPSGEEAVLNATSGEPVNMLSHRQDNEEKIEPSVLRGLYEISTYVPPVPIPASSRLGIVGSANEYPDLRDQATFRARYVTSAQDETITWGVIDRNVPPGLNTNRANLFAQYAGGIAYPIPVTFYKGTGVPLPLTGAKKVTPTADDAIHHWLRFATGQPSNPHTIGLISGGLREGSLPPDYLDALCDLFKKLGGRGTSVLVPSGDTGVGMGNFKKFNLNFPASCPFVTSVGATTGNPEVASVFSGGGFSEYFPIPDYQKDQVNGFIGSIGDTYIGRYSTDGRGAPDISAQSERYSYIYKGKVNDLDSTACSTATATAIIALLNNDRLSLGIEPLGFLNPWLYGDGKAGFKDILKGNNPGAKTDGFFASKGWDPVTGLGTPKFQELLPLARVAPAFRLPEEPPERRNQSSQNQP